MDHKSLYDLSLRTFLSPVLHLLDDPEVTEIMVNGPERIYFERKGKIYPAGCSFPDERMLLAAVLNIAEFVDRPLGDGHLSMDARLPDGSRVHVILPPVSRVGICLTIRKFKKAGFTLDELVSSGSIDEAGKNVLVEGISDHKNIIVAGGTGTGKTTVLNALSAFISPSERIVVIEESSELQLSQPHTIYLETRTDQDPDLPVFSVRELFVNSLRMRPDRILIGEVRRGEALELVQSMLSGHSGSLATLHASTPQAAATRLETLCMMNEMQIPIMVARAQVAEAIDWVVQTKRHPSGRRYISEIAEVKGLDANQSYQWQTIWRSESSVATTRAVLC
jgi:pilus assembly protein CpaF